MKNFLMRAAAGPFDNPSHFRGISENMVNGNTGNLMFTHSISRALMLEGVSIDYTKTDHYISAGEAEEMNAKYDCFVIPLANAFRKDFEFELNYLTDMVKKLDMPCIVIGVGYQGELSDSANKEQPMDESVQAFMKAVLKKSASVGLRGEMTAKYLERLGFKRERDFTVIGCPSMYLYGEDLPHPKPLELTPQSRINLNCKVVLPQKIHDFMNVVCEQIPDHYYIPQNTYELKTVYCGMPLKYSRNVKVPANYPGDLSHKLYRENRVRGFVTAESWMNFLAQGDMNFGTRIHGNIAGILAGVPVYIVAPDTRVLELSNYHNIPHMTMEELDPAMNIFDIVKDVDFDQIQIGHRERFAHYMDFMHDNGFDTIFDHELETIPFDEKVKETDFLGPVMPLPFASAEEQAEAMKMWTDKIDELRAKNKKLRYDVKHPARSTARRAKRRLIRKIRTRSVKK
ncbi:MAG: polysaccharide pyruvyl transferase family protein [Eubacteriaceae bacterium]|jgi:hypothetical protein|nr:polysaccharide pyruvyl transferase family protein [Eubacteriaceae bacterium]